MEKTSPSFAVRLEGFLFYDIGFGRGVGLADDTVKAALSGVEPVQAFGGLEGRSRPYGFGRG